MLAPSTQRGQCLFCSFRALVARTPKPIYNVQRTFISTPRAREVRKTNPPGSAPAAAVRIRRHVRKTPGSQDFSFSDENVLKRVQLALKDLKKDLSSREDVSDSEPSPLEALDPGGTHWPDYTTRLRDILEFRGEKATAQEERLLYEIGSAQSNKSSTQDLQRVLHYGFIDFALVKNVEDGTLSKSAITDLRYPTEWYTAARQIQRNVHLHIGPTNSGKTYNALKRLEEKGNGFYAGPLRLLAHEVYSRFKAKGAKCDLVTGDDIRRDDDPNVSLYASTVEMVDVSTPVEVAVIDEIQMIASEDRGWAWTRAFLGANAKEVHLCGETRVLPLVRELCAATGDTLQVHEYKRLNPLKVMTKSLGGDLKNLRKADCIVTFSVMNIHALKKQIELDTGRHCAIVYGSLPPETRAAQAALFNDPDNDYDFLVASDAIGMGLNLSVKRIIFHRVHKFNGVSHEQLSVPQIKQIGGRAGRYRSAHQQMSDGKSKSSSEVSVGLVTTLNEEDLPIVRQAMNAEAPPLKVAGLLPPGDFMEDLAARLPKGIPYEYILRRVADSAAMHRRFKMCSIRDQSDIARSIESVRGLSVTDRIIFVAAPWSKGSTRVNAVAQALARCIAQKREISIIDVPEIDLEALEVPISGDRSYLESLEDLHKSLVLFLWLSYRFISNLKDREMAFYAKGLVEDKINTCLVEFSANPDLRKRVLAYKKRMSIPAVPTDGTALPESSSQLDLPAEHETALPVDWMRGSSGAESGESQSVAAAAAAA
ncbi:RNA helicase [Exophiala xenobiotica]|uniref:ATP-dependent RNA helicase SUV3, mitochondrial n=1 Tax=Vermiconidia calcicola TaxID=1690605 RepID=A0AAV9PYM1_9PEZI|nr:RNA helicase [Exophiala xenobiotica]KAK5532241.1 RNA helicase [Vermiconidia calcicola]KAK5533584.1 RNA helicase [Chaetothyriales sp. CCFEE 6169]KAK5204032.1 RNA helicase [Exophiala xenobiotica]KAK5227609.1 RNA helicase [Exophiala xenobiotica]